MSSGEKVLSRPRKSPAYKSPVIAVNEYSAVTPLMQQRIRPQQAIVLRDAGRALLALATKNGTAEVEVPELHNMEALRDYQDDLFVVGYFDDTLQRQATSQPLRSDLQTLAGHLTCIDQDVTLRHLQEITAAAHLVESSAGDWSVGKLAGGIAYVVAELIETLQSRHIRR